MFRSKVAQTLQEHAKWGVPVVLEGASLGFRDEIELVRDEAREVMAAESAQIQIVHVAVQPGHEQWIENLRRRLARRQLPFEPQRFPKREYERRFIGPVQVDGVETRVVTSTADMKRLAEDLEIPRFGFYQGFEIGPLKVKGGISSNEKVETIASQHVVGKAVLDLCCNTAATAILVKNRGARRVVGVERNDAVYRKSQHLREIVAHQADVDTTVELHHGDIFDITPTLGQFDTVLFFATLHYFPDHVKVLRLLNAAARETVYLELSPTDHPESSAGSPSEGVSTLDQTPGVRPYTRASGMAAWLTDSETMKSLIARAMPGFSVVNRAPVSRPPKEDPSAYREVWTLGRESI